MNLSDDARKFLTEMVLKEKFGSSYGESCRSFITHTDLIALYKAVYEDGNWDDLDSYLADVWMITQDVTGNYSSWLMCLNTPEEIPDRCMMVAEFYGYREGMDRGRYQCDNCG